MGLLKFKGGINLQKTKKQSVSQNLGSSFALIKRHYILVGIILSITTGKTSFIKVECLPINSLKNGGNTTFEI